MRQLMLEMLHPRVHRDLLVFGELHACLAQAMFDRLHGKTARQFLGRIRPILAKCRSVASVNLDGEN
jgi:hypothetical protein